MIYICNNILPNLEEEACNGPKLLRFLCIAVEVGVSERRAILTAIVNHVDIGARAKVLGNLAADYLTNFDTNPIVIKNVAEKSATIGIPSKLVFEND